MFHLGLVDVIQADREREVASAIRRRQLLQPQDGPTEPVAVPARDATRRRTLAVRIRPTGG